MNNRLGSHWQGYVGQHLAEWEHRGNQSVRSIYDRIEQGPAPYHRATHSVPVQHRLSRNDGFVEHHNGGSVFDRLDGAPKRNKNSKRQADPNGKLSKALQWKLRNEARNERAANEVVVTGSTLDAITAISKAPADTTDWDTVIQDALDGVKITQEEIDQKELVLALIEETLKPKYPRAICRMFGSSETRLGFKDSDVDINVSLGYDPYDNAIKKEGKAKAAKLTRQLGFSFKQHAELRVVSMIPHCRVPLVKLYHKPSKTRVDLSFRSSFGVSNSSLVRLLCDSHPQVRPFMLFLKLWATAHNVSGPGRPNKRVTNYTLSLLALFTCMTREQKLVPSLEDLRKQPFESNMIEDWECGYGTDVAAYWQTQEEGPPAHVEGGVLALALEFFEFYAALDSFKWAVCPSVGRLVSREVLRPSDDAAPVVEDTGDADSDWGETDYKTPVDTLDEDTAMVTDNSTEDAIADSVGTDATLSTEAVETDSTTPIDTESTDGTGVTETLAEDSTTGTDAETGDNTGMEVAVDASAVAEDGHVTNDSTPAGTKPDIAADGNNDATVANNVSNTVTGPAVDSGTDSLPEALVPHLARLKSLNRKAPLCVMDIFTLNTNITSHYHLQNLKAFQKKCLLSAKIIKEVQKQEKPLSALFSKLEDFE